MTTGELRANLTKACDIIREASKKLWAASSDLPKDLEINVSRLPVAAATARDVAATLEYMRVYLLIDEDGNERQLSADELGKICAIIRQHLWFVRDLIGGILYDPAMTDLWVLSTAIAEMMGNFSQKDDQ